MVISVAQPLAAQLFTHVGGNVGFGQSKILGEKSEFERVKEVQNFSLGLTAEHRFDSPFLITTGINFTGFGDSTIFKHSVVANNTTITSINRYKNMRYYVQIPICVAVIIPAGEDNAGIMIKAGAYYGSLLGSRTTGMQRLVSGSVVTDSIIDTKAFNAYPKREFGLVAALGYDVEQYSVEFRFNRGLTSLFNQPGDKAKYNFAYMISLIGYLPN